ncbi:prostate and testis expressed protein 3-like [Meriones unguiculatus]|uniref:prostate and testis expressed protein 3-like n=1 Tax=Meriones unguiculatus TaxID=10047 RepID=UPI001087DE45|nr:prostate and testis expressed protein 3-like [Meriones unguiculatus]
MGNLQELGIVLLFCMQTALALRCRECTSYLYQECRHKVRTCIAEDDESCMTTRLWLLPFKVNEPEDGYSKCQKNCTRDDYNYDDHAVLISCCDTYDFCNDISVPIDEWY